MERVINKTKPSFMQIFVYLISFVHGMQDVYQHHILRLDRNLSFGQNLAKTKVENKNPFVSKAISVVLKAISKRF